MIEDRKFSFDCFCGVCETESKVTSWCRGNERKYKLEKNNCISGKTIRQCVAGAIKALAQFIYLKFILFLFIAENIAEVPSTPLPAPLQAFTTLLFMSIGYAYVHVSYLVNLPHLYPISSEICQSVHFSESILFISLFKLLRFKEKSASMTMRGWEGGRGKRYLLSWSEFILKVAIFFKYFTNNSVLLKGGCAIYWPGHFKPVLVVKGIWITHWELYIESFKNHYTCLLLSFLMNENTRGIKDEQI